jgi:hypothetical protein
VLRLAPDRCHCILVGVRPCRKYEFSVFKSSDQAGGRKLSIRREALS